MDSSDPNFGFSMKQLRLAKQMTIQQVADHMENNKSHVIKIEKGNNVTRNTLVSYLNAVGAKMHFTQD